MPVLFVFRLLCLTNLAEWGMIDLIQYISPERSVRSEGKMYEPKKNRRSETNPAAKEPSLRNYLLIAAVFLTAVALSFLFIRYTYRQLYYENDLLPVSEQKNRKRRESIMTVNTEKTDDTLTIILDGALNKTTCDAVAERIASEMQGIRKLVFDMEKLTFISSAGLRVLVKLRKQVGKRENMELCNVQPDVMNIFSVTGLAEYLNIRQEN